MLRVTGAAPKAASRATTPTGGIKRASGSRPRALRPGKVRLEVPITASTWGPLLGLSPLMAAIDRCR
jgi:hypothetical protein